MALVKVGLSDEDVYNINCNLLWKTLVETSLGTFKHGPMFIHDNVTGLTTHFESARREGKSDMADSLAMVFNAGRDKYQWTPAELDRFRKLNEGKTAMSLASADIHPDTIGIKLNRVTPPKVEVEKVKPKYHVKITGPATGAKSATTDAHGASLKEVRALMREAKEIGAPDDATFNAGSYMETNTASITWEYSK